MGLGSKSPVTRRRYHTTGGLTSFTPDSVPTQSRAALRIFALHEKWSAPQHCGSALAGNKTSANPDALTKLLLPCFFDDLAAPNTEDR
jgi:hypothetical protein